MPYNTVDPRATAVLFFDVLNAYCKDESGQLLPHLLPVIANDVRIMNAARGASIPIFYAKADHRADGADAADQLTDTDHGLKPWPNPETGHYRPGKNLAGGTWNTEVIDEIKPQPGDYVILKHRWNAFFQTNLELSLRTRGIDTIILCGGSTDVGVASTAYGARDLDYNLVIVRDACSASVRENTALFMDRVFPRMARVRTTDQVIEMIRLGHQASK